MRRFLISVGAFLCLYAVSAGTGYAGALQDVMKQQDDKNAFLAQCTDSATTQSRIDAFYAAVTKSDKCIDITRDHFLSHNPYTSALWYLHPTASHAADTHKADTPEARDLTELLLQKKDCRKAVLQYDGSVNTYVSEMIRAAKKYDADFDKLMASYVKGKITRSDLSLKGEKILTTYNEKIDGIVDENSYSYEQKKTYCLAQYDSPRHKQHLPGTPIQIAVVSPASPFVLGPSVPARTQDDDADARRKKQQEDDEMMQMNNARRGR